MKRVNVVGSTGAGKSTFARRLAAQIDARFVEADAVFWLPNWGEPDDPAFFAKLSEALAGDAWVLDGNFDRTRAIKWARVEMVVWLDYSFTRVALQSLRRAVTRAWARDELWPGTGNRESFRQTFFSRKSILWWMLKSYPNIRRRYARDLRSPDYPHIEFVRLRNPGEAERFLERWSERCG